MSERRHTNGGLLVEPPNEATYVVVGGGAGGAPAAAQLAETTGETVVLLEAGPDYGPFSRETWPTDLLDARTIPLSHDWGYSSAEAKAGQIRQCANMDDGNCDLWSVTREFQCTGGKSGEGAFVSRLSR